ncbi:unnamed protein product [Rotaria sp. Silwood1]|nr:unnamed protein product [Rotaria sp. Silwood1]
MPTATVSIRPICLCCVPASISLHRPATRAHKATAAHDRSLQHQQVATKAENAYSIVIVDRDATLNSTAFAAEEHDYFDYRVSHFSRIDFAIGDYEVSFDNAVARYF